MMRFSFLSGRLSEGNSEHLLWNISFGFVCVLQTLSGSVAVKGVEHKTAFIEGQGSR